MRVLPAVLLALLCLAAAGPALAGPLDMVINVVSNRADLISGGDALVEVVPPPDVNTSDVRVSLNGADVTGAFAVRDNGRFMGLLVDLLVGDNVVVASVDPSAPGRRPRAQITITNYKIGGPVFSGAQLQPWVCARPAVTPVVVTVPGTSLTATVNSRASALADGPITDPDFVAENGDCNATTSRAFFYQPKEREGGTCVFSNAGTNRCFEPYNSASPPADDAIANFTNDRGDIVKSIIVLERGTVDRAMYQLVTFYDPTKAIAPWAPQRGWNGKLLWKMGASASVSRFQSPPATGVFDDKALRRGFMVASSSFTDHGTNSNDTFGAEVMVMIKEHIAENYGPIRYTIGDGCSGGSIMQHSISGAYPGLLNAIQPNCSFSDTQTTFIEIADCGILQNKYYTTPNGSALTAAQRAAINGHSNTGFCNAWIISFLNAGNPAVQGNCGSGWPAALTYSTTSSPPRGNGVRCTGADHDAGMVGTFVDTDGNTKANQPGDNVGVQYGLKPLHDGLITPEQFVQLNEGAGGYNADLVWTGAPGGNVSAGLIIPAPRQTAREDVLKTYYSGGLVSDGRQLAKLPIIDLRGNQASAGDIHMNWRAWATRDRLDRQYGEHANHLIWAYNGGGGAGTPGAALVLRSFLLLDQWLANIENDPTPLPIELKVRANKPVDAHDMCLTNTGATEPLVDVGLGNPACPVTFQASPRQAAGGPLAENVFKCSLKPLDLSDPAYGGATFTTDQQMRLAAVFPTGVCDWSKLGVGQVPEVPYTTFKDGPGGKPLGDPPVSMAVNQPPDALCTNVTASASSSCTATASVNNGSTDPDGDAITLMQSPAGPYGLGATGVTLTATDASGLSSSCMGTVTVVDTTPPTITCPAPVTAECTGNSAATVNVAPATATDNCSVLTVQGPSGANVFPLGTTNVTFTATDGSGNKASCATSVTVADTTAPSISCPAPMIVECTGNSSATVTPGAATAVDVCTGVTVQNPPAGVFPLGTTTVAYTATDQVGHQAACTSTITVVDTTGPTIGGVTASPNVLWPANHKFVPVTIGVTASDTCTGATPSCHVTAVSVNEPVNASSGSPFQITGPLSLNLLAERNGNGTGRVYSVDVQCADAAGNVAVKTVTVSVPHDQRN